MSIKQIKFISLAALLLIALTACGANLQEHARLSLELKKISYDAETFVNQARAGNLEAVQLFLQTGMSPDVVSPRGYMPLTEAARYNRGAIVRLLLEERADPDFKDPFQGATTLMWASVGGYDGVVELLQKTGAPEGTKD